MGRHSDSSDEETSPVDEKSDKATDSSNEERLKERKSIHKKSKHSSSRKKKSKDKKRKKKSKKHRKQQSSSETDTSNSEDEWVVKSQPAPSKHSHTDADNSDEVAFKMPKLQIPASSKRSKEHEEEEWMNFSDTLPTFSNEAKRSERRKLKDKERESSSIDQLGQHVNELNPYWKDGGTGLPDEKIESKPTESSTQLIGDGGLNYLRKAFTRAKEQAAEEGRDVGDIISERWGSLEKFLGMLEDAESKSKETTENRKHRESKHGRFIRPSADSDEDTNAGNKRFGHASRRHRHRHDRSRERRRSRERDSGWRKTRSSPERMHAKRKESTDEVLQMNEKRDLVTSPDTKKLNRQSTVSYEPQKSQVSGSGIVSEKSPSPSLISDEQSAEVQKKVLTDKEMNELNAKLLKAEMLGNTSLVEELTAKITEAEQERQDFIKNGGDTSKPQMASTKVVTKVMIGNNYDRKRKDKITETHKDGQRVRYFPDDDKYSLQNMFHREKMNTAADENALFARLAGKGAKTGQDYDIDDVFADKASSSKQSRKEEEKELRDVLENEKHYNKVLDSCSWCFDGSGIEKHLILSVAEKCYLCVPPYKSMTDGHCLIVPMSHVSCSTELDEDVWAEMQKFRKALVNMFRKTDQDMVIFETSLFLKRHPHMYLECIPMPKETGELAPIYFKKAIQECETEWSQNQKIVDLRNRDVRRAIPKGLPYFAVDFGDHSCGFAHVVEDERNFPRNFAHEIVGGMLELDHHLWRKQKKDDFKMQRSKVMEFLKSWAPHDWTRESK